MRVVGKACGSKLEKNTCFLGGVLGPVVPMLWSLVAGAQGQPRAAHGQHGGQVGGCDMGNLSPGSCCQLQLTQPDPSSSTAVSQPCQCPTLTLWVQTMSPWPYLAIPGLCLTLVPFTGPDPDPHSWTD